VTVLKNGAGATHLGFLWAATLGHSPSQPRGGRCSPNPQLVFALWLRPSHQSRRGSRQDRACAIHWLPGRRLKPLARAADDLNTNSPPEWRANHRQGETMTFGLIGAGLGIVMIVVAGAHRRLLPDRGSMISGDPVSLREAARGCSSRQDLW
jgi:hypothetical protein